MKIILAFTIMCTFADFNNLYTYVEPQHVYTDNSYVLSQYVDDNGNLVRRTAPTTQVVLKDGVRQVVNSWNWPYASNYWFNGDYLARPYHTGWVMGDDMYNWRWNNWGNWNNWGYGNYYPYTNSYVMVGDSK